MSKKPRKRQLGDASEEPEMKLMKVEEKLELVEDKVEKLMVTAEAIHKMVSSACSSFLSLPSTSGSYLKKLEEQLKCAICLDTYTDPKLLQCFHVYCRQCLVGLVVQDQEDQELILTCPTCRQITPLPANGVRGLQPAFHINKLFDGLKEVRYMLRCFEHEGRGCELYCETCEEFICIECSLRGQKHQGHGYVFAREKQMDPSKCHITGKGLEVAEVREKSTALLQVINFRGEPCEESIKLFERELVSEITGTTVRGSVERKGHSCYEISYQPTIKGRHQLHIKVRNQPIRGSPFTVRVKLPIEKLSSTPILSICDIDGPCAVAVNQSGEMVIPERDGDCVSIFSSRGERLWSFGTHGSAEGQFHNPYGVAVDGEGNILVTDYKNHRIQKFTSDGQFLAAVGTLGSGHLQFYYPQNITFNPTNNKLYVADEENHRVQILNSDLTFSSTFGRAGSGNGEFNCPCTTACDSTGKVYVADTDNHRIQVFTAEGEFLRTFNNNHKCYPFTVAFDDSDIVYVDGDVFTSEGKYLTSFGNEESVFYGLTVDSSGVVYACDYESSVVQLL